jgi:hypothetical protein
MATLRTQGLKEIPWMMISVMAQSFLLVRWAFPQFEGPCPIGRRSRWKFIAGVPLGLASTRRRGAAATPSLLAMSSRALDRPNPVEGVYFEGGSKIMQAHTGLEVVAMTVGGVGVVV